MRTRTFGFALACAALTGVAGPAAAKAVGGRDWTITDIVEAPSVIDLALSQDGSDVAYILRRGDMSGNRETFELHVVSIASRRDRIVATSSWLGMLRLIPSQGGWSVLGDFGEGVQLYRFDRSGARTTVVSQPDPVLVGSADGAVPGMPNDPPTRFGVVSYAWRPDGRAVFYTALDRKKASSTPLFDAAVVEASSRRRWEPEVDVRFVVSDENGKPLAVASRPTSDRIARFAGGDAQWQDEALYYSTMESVEGMPRITRWRWNAADGASNPVETDAGFSSPWLGPHGGAVSVRGYGADRKIVETGHDGREHDHGLFAGTLSDPRSPGIWRSPEGQRVLVAVRIGDNPRYSILLLTKDGRRRLYEAAGSLTNCSFDSRLRGGVCIQQGVAIPPKIVSIDLGSGQIRPLIEIAPRYNLLRKSEMEARIWRNRMGFKSSGFVIRPDHYEPRKRYPLILITHGSDADERFLSADLVWNFPIQLFLQRGYIVALVNDPSPTQSETLAMAASAWSNCGKGVGPERVQNLMWLNGVASYEAVVQDLASEGVVDPDRVGVAGYSRGSQMVNVAMTNSRLFRAASSGDGGYLEPAAWRYNRCSYAGVFGGRPGTAFTDPLYRRLTPSYRAAEASGAILQQMAEPRPGAVDFHQSLREAGVPAQITLFPGNSEASDETHLFHIPTNRAAAMRENLCWFDFWLKDVSGSSVDCPRIDDWNAMAISWRNHKSDG